MIQHIYPIDRENIAFAIHKVSAPSEKLDFITTVLKEKKVPTIIYFSSRKAAEDLADKLSSRLSNYRIAFYHGNMDQYDRLMIQQQFMHDQLDVICCTSAFGMGVNKSNIHLIIHYHLPNQIESFIQEVGRAGRDGAESVSILLYNENDVYLPQKMIENELPSESMIDYAFKILYRFTQTQEALPTNENEIELTFGLNEIQWRFLKSQLEKYTILKENKVIYEEDSWKNAKEKICLIAQERYKIKHSKLREMLNWVNEKSCLRQKLYETFQETYSNPPFQCCSNCGFSLNEWSVQQEDKPTQQLLTWEEKLKKLFMIEEIDEAK